MIEKFISIKNVGKFVNYSAPKHVELEKFNIIYGENATGKTTLSAILRSLKTNKKEYIIGRKKIDSDEDPEIKIRLEGENVEFSGGSWNKSFPNIEIFDAIFIAENVCAGYYVDHQHKKNFHGFAIGEEGVKLANEIVSLDENIREKNVQIKEKEREIKRWIIGDLPLNKFLDLPKDDEIDDKITAQQELISTLEQSDTLIKKAPLTPVDIPVWSFEKMKNLLSKSLATISKKAEKKVREHIQNYLNEEGERWIEYGLNHIRDDKCPFCGQSLKDVDLIQAYQDYFDTAYKDFKADIKKHLDEEKSTFSNDNLLKIQRTLSDNNALIEFWSQYITFSFQLITIDFERIKNCWDGLSKGLFEHLEKKLLNPLESVVPNEMLLSAIALFKSIQSSINQYNWQVFEGNNLIQKKKESVRIGNLNDAKQELIKLQNQQKRFLTEAVLLCDGYKTEKNEKKDLEKQKKTTKRDLDQLTNEVIAEFQPNINKHLGKFGADFCIANQQTKYTGGKPSVNYDIELNAKCIPLGDSDTPEDQPSFRNTLSEGDKGTLAFAFFMARLDQDKSIASKTIVFDDPINSLDTNRKHSTVWNILRVSQKAKQVIVQTHDPIFARYLWNETEDKSSIKCLCVNREGKGSVISEWDIEKETAGEYFQNYFALEKFLEDGSGDLRAVARCIRPLLEGNLRLRVPGSFKESEWLGNFISNIRNADKSAPLCVIKPHLEELEEINSYSKQYHHSSQNPNADSMPIKETELKGYVKRTLKFIGLVFNVEDL
jgi:wobble nucleotide-excising tRNase